jgi:hypothetical protein
VLLAALFALSPTRAVANERPRVEIPLADSAETFAAAGARIPRLAADEWGIRGMWRGRITPNHTTVLVVWFESNAQTMSDPTISKAADRLFDRLRPELIGMPAIEVVVMKPFLPIFLGDYSLRGSGPVWIRDGQRWRRPAESARGREILLPMLRDLTWRPPSSPPPSAAPTRH